MFILAYLKSLRLLKIEKIVYVIMLLCYYDASYITLHYIEII